MKIGLKSIAICFAFANGYGLLKSCPDVKDAKWEALIIRQLKNLMKTRNEYIFPDGSFIVEIPSEFKSRLTS